MELAFAAPVLLMLLAGTADVVNFLRAQARIESAATQLAQIVSQCNRITASILTAGNISDSTVFRAFAQAAVGNLATLGVSPDDLVISAIGIPTGQTTPRVRWQLRAVQPSTTTFVPSVGTPVAAASFTQRGNMWLGVGAPGNAATLTNGMTLQVGQTLFAVEINADQPTWVLSVGFMGSLLGSLNSTAMFISRASDAPQLQSAPANLNNPDCTA